MDAGKQECSRRIGKDGKKIPYRQTSRITGIISGRRLMFFWM